VSVVRRYSHEQSDVRLSGTPAGRWRCAASAAMWSGWWGAGSDLGANASTPRVARSVSCESIWSSSATGWAARTPLCGMHSLGIAVCEGCPSGCRVTSVPCTSREEARGMSDEMSRRAREPPTGTTPRSPVRKVGMATSAAMAQREGARR